MMYINHIKWYIARNIPVYFICMILVFGFWIHSEFYQYGLTSLLFVGGFVTFLVIKSVSLFNVTGFLRPYQGVMLFNNNEVERLKNGKIKKIIRKDAKNECVKEGNIIRAKLTLDSDDFFSEIIITGVQRKKMMELDEADAFICGYDSIKELTEDLSSMHNLIKRNDVVRIISFKLISKGKYLGK